MKRLFLIPFFFLALVANAQIQTINTGSTANDGTGDKARAAFTKTNQNFVYVMQQLALKPDSVLLRQYIDAQLNLKASIVYVDNALSSYVPSTRTVNGKALSSNITINKGDVGLGSADNTADLDKPISTATQAAIDAIVRYGTIATGINNQPYYESTLNYHAFRGKAAGGTRFYIMPNGSVGTALASKFEMFIDDYSSLSASYRAFNIMAYSTGIHIGPNRSSIASRVSMTLAGEYVASDKDNITSNRITFQTNDNLDYRAANHQFQTVGGTTAFAINPSTGVWTINGSTGTNGQVPTSNGSGVVSWQAGAGTAADVIDATTTSTAGGTITLDMNNQKQRTHSGNASFATSKTVAMSNNYTIPVAFSFHFTVTSTSATLIVPTDWRMLISTAFDGTTWTPPSTGPFKISGTWNPVSSTWECNWSGPYQ